MNGVLDHLCAHVGWTGPGEPPGDGEMSEMTLPSRHKIRNSSTWRSETEHATSWWRRLLTTLSFTSEWGRNSFVSFKPPRTGTEHNVRTLSWKAAMQALSKGPRPYNRVIHNSVYPVNSPGGAVQPQPNLPSNHRSYILCICIPYYF